MSLLLLFGGVPNKVKYWDGTQWVYRTMNVYSGYSARFIVDNTGGVNLNYLQATSYTPATDASFDMRISVTRVADGGSRRPVNGSFFGIWGGTGGLTVSFFDGASYPNLFVSSATLDAVAAVGDPIDLRFRWNASTDTLDISARPRTGLAMSDDTGWTVQGSTVHSGKSMAVRSMTERLGFSDVTTDDFTGSYYGFRVAVNGTLTREITPTDISQYSGTSTFNTEAGQTWTVVGTVTSDRATFTQSKSVKVWNGSSWIPAK